MPLRMARLPQLQKRLRRYGKMERAKLGKSTSSSATEKCRVQYIVKNFMVQIHQLKSWFSLWQAEYCTFTNQQVFMLMSYTACSVEIPPAFTKGSEDDIYYDNAVAGFVSIMVDATREMKCYNATGCDSAALICLLKEPTLVEDGQPIRCVLRVAIGAPRQKSLSPCL